MVVEFLPCRVHRQITASSNIRPRRYVYFAFLYFLVLLDRLMVDNEHALVWYRTLIHDCRWAVLLHKEQATSHRPLMMLVIRHTTLQRVWSLDRYFVIGLIFRIGTLVSTRCLVREHRYDPVPTMRINVR